jgi:hypothetical protein
MENLAWICRGLWGSCGLVFRTKTISGTGYFDSPIMQSAVFVSCGLAECYQFQFLRMPVYNWLIGYMVLVRTV